MGLGIQSTLIEPPISWSVYSHKEEKWGRPPSRGQFFLHRLKERMIVFGEHQDYKCLLCLRYTCYEQVKSIFFFS